MAENCVAVPFPAVRHVTYWLDRPQPAPGWGHFLESWRSLVERPSSAFGVPLMRS